MTEYQIEVIDLSPRNRQLELSHQSTPHITAGVVSIDWNNREFILGAVMPPFRGGTRPPNVTGRSWRWRLEDAAERSLVAACGFNPEGVL